MTVYSTLYVFLTRYETVGEEVIIGDSQLMEEWDVITLYLQVGLSKKLIMDVISHEHVHLVLGELIHQGEIEESASDQFDNISSYLTEEPYYYLLSEREKH